MAYSPNFPETLGRDLLSKAGLVGEVYAPTGTAYEKGYFDGTARVRAFLLASGIHNFDEQSLGENHRITARAELASPSQVVDTEIAFFRPNKGDRRVRVTGLRQLSRPDDLLGFVVQNGKLIVLNLSDEDTRADLLNQESWLRHQVGTSPDTSSRGNLPNGRPPRESIPGGRTQRVTNVRRGQGRFRELLMDAYESTCAATGCEVVEILVAAHIEQFAIGLCHAVENGILLRSDIHDLYDAHLITILPDGTIRTSPALLGSEYEHLDSRVCRLPSAPELRPSAGRLIDHNCQCPWLEADGENDQTQVD